MFYFYKSYDTLRLGARNKILQKSEITFALLLFELNNRVMEAV